MKKQKEDLDKLCMSNPEAVLSLLKKFFLEAIEKNSSADPLKILQREDLMQASEAMQTLRDSTARFDSAFVPEVLISGMRSQWAAEAASREMPRRKR